MGIAYLGEKLEARLGLGQEYSKDEIFRALQEIGAVKDNAWGKLKTEWYLRKLHKDFGMGSLYWFYFQKTGAGNYCLKRDMEDF